MTCYNKSPTLPSSSTNPSDQPTSPIASAKSPRLHSSPVLLLPLPPASAMEKESVFQSELELNRQTRQLQRERDLEEALQDQVWQLERAALREEQGTWSRRQQENSKSKGRTDDDKWGNTQGFIRPPQAYELYQAIDKHDIDFIMRVRDHAFKLLLQKNGSEFPIVYAARLGEGWRDIVILLVGTLSRFVNHLEPEDFSKKETKDTLKGLPTYDLTLLLRASPLRTSKPVAHAEEMVRRFCTKELRGVAGGIGEVEEYVANAALDLVIMAVWSLAAGQLDLENLPTHTFARDLRTYQTFTEALQEKSAQISKANPRVRKMLKAVEEFGGDSKKSVRGRLRDVAQFFDEGEL
ncbi:hypothetical protein I307_04466 [Cryptococcus deuterogattii 99/473]|uniref:Uncharacterized protein n=1 Tax=Cryptococcus deuterogattii Ram5 TaxID=1296110 RepID=A0A0D0U2S9_9TREE|nr:hypothetical protein I352_02052 [Cryptococcus deuterogattii MMRL2647]KIR42503.1 hypothetical protein I313_01729 [Cryptococcus deuterogattii Ram5]KIR72671.1 hypothetical protein I310_03271 [Cryptococcus deuterogattii CA1014]KIS00331.1 hypothetical protein L804_01742 [Cryptococcus deuterogattii 2001/935-1]KIY56073.1 hypothetical protein I307_04466 [Cryptococcus deuterogattii 99/473]